MSEDDMHVIPTNDLVAHESNADCTCGPECQPTPRVDGSLGYIYVHHSLDRREGMGLRLLWGDDEGDCS